MIKTSDIQTDIYRSYFYCLEFFDFSINCNIH